MVDSIRVSGLLELKTELRAAGAEFPKELRRANLKAAEVIVTGTKSEFSSMGGSAVLVVPTVKALATQNRAQVKVGGGASRGSYVAMGNLWGAKRFPQFPARRAGGYALYPTIARRDEVVNVYLDALDALLGRAFPD